MSVVVHLATHGAKAIWICGFSKNTTASLFVPDSHASYIFSPIEKSHTMLAGKGIGHLTQI